MISKASVRKMSQIAGENVVPAVDQCDTFGAFVANELRDLGNASNDTIFRIVKRRILTIIFTDVGCVRVIHQHQCTTNVECN